MSTDGQPEVQPKVHAPSTDLLGAVDFPAQRALGSRLVRPLPSRVYHYTRKESGLAIVRTSSMWASHIRYLPRDPDEYSTGLAFVEQRLRTMMAAETDAYVFDLIGRWAAQWPRIKGHDRLVACLSGSRDLASQWREYGSGGYSLAFDAAVLNEIASTNNYILVDCIYDGHESVCAALIADALDVYQRCREHGYDHDDAALCAKFLFEIPISTVMPRLKKASFRPEAEWRLHSLLPLQNRPAPGLTYRSRRDGHVPYEPVAIRAPDGKSALREIMIAPGADSASARRELEDILSDSGYSHVAITASTLR